MAPTSIARDRKARLSEICLALPGTTRDDQDPHAGFKIGKKVFAYYLDDHHGDGIIGFCCKVLPGENQRLIEANPRKFYMPAYVGARGWVGLRLDRPTVDWTEVKELIRGSYLLTAPKKLAKLIEDAETP